MAGSAGARRMIPYKHESVEVFHFLLISQNDRNTDSWTHNHLDIANT